MKKRALTLFLALLAALMLTVPVWAETQPGDSFIYDDVGILSEENIASLEQMAEQVTWRYNCGVYVVVIQDYTEYGDSRYTAAQNIYNNMDFGVGSNRDGIMLMLSMWDRDYELYVKDYGVSEEAFSPYALDLLKEEFLDNFADDDWIGGFTDYMNNCADYLDRAEQGNLRFWVAPSLMRG